MLKPASAARLTQTSYRFCDSDECETVYFGEDGTTFSKSDVSVRVGVKEHSAPRLVCYCFDHTIEEINAEVKETGMSTVLDDIKERMNLACWCETKSPKGSCCLGTVSKHVKLALDEHGKHDEHDEQDELVGHGASRESTAACEEFEDCCAAGAHDDSVEACCGTTASKPQRTGILAAGGSMLAALAASACCWLPLGLIVFGVSAGGVSVWFEHYRWLFLGITTVLLGLGFYFVYFREPRCAPGAACAAPNRSVQRFNRSMLWIATAFVIVSASFPKYVGYLLPKDSPMTDAGEASQLRVTTFEIAGMSCEACTISLRNELVKVPGVVDIAVSYQDGAAQLSFDAANPPSAEELTKVVARVGYQAGPIALDED